MFKTILISFFKFKPTIIALDPQKRLSKFQASKLNHSLFLIKNNCPLQYITGKSFFLNLEINVDSNVLIPRPETEELALWSTKSLTNGDKVIDLCTGSGCIALALKTNNPSISVKGIDKSERAILLAKKNSKNLNIDIEWVTADVIDFQEEKCSLDLVISNPPYIHPSEIKSIQPRVINYEPKLALFTPNDDPIYYYKHCINFANNALKKGGKLFFELNPNYYKKVENQVLRSNFSEVEIKKDFMGKKRMLSATKS
tara:strand:- start:194 stop:961 length:768 start_codon:yes stop_codon:yes gene_type:complete